jgi:hypothetical protein
LLFLFRADVFVPLLAPMLATEETPACIVLDYDNHEHEDEDEVFESALEMSREQFNEIATYIW